MKQLAGSDPKRGRSTPRAVRRGGRSDGRLNAPCRSRRDQWFAPVRPRAAWLGVSIASIWRGGYIIRARFLQKITDAYSRDPRLVNLLLDPYFKEQIQKNQTRWRSIVALAAEAGIAAPAFMSALAYYDGYRSAQLPANLLQAQRDYFGAHNLRTYRSTTTCIVPSRLVQTRPSADQNYRFPLEKG